MPTRTIYLDDDQSRLADALSEQEGVKFSRVFQLLLDRVGDTRSGLRRLASILPGAAAPAAASLSPWTGAGAGDTYDLGAWIDTETTKRVVIFAATADSVIGGRENAWRRFLSHGGELKVVLQGGIVGDGDPGVRGATLSLHGETPARLRARQQRALGVLDTLARERVGTLELRLSPALLTSAMLFFWRADLRTVDIQLHPYGLGQPRVLWSATVGDDVMMALDQAAAEIWENATEFEGLGSGFSVVENSSS